MHGLAKRPGFMLVVSLILALAIGANSAVPAWRATRVDPIWTLKAE